MSSPVKQSSHHINELLTQVSPISPLIASARASQKCLQMLAQSLSPGLYNACLPGAIENGEWCLMARNAAVANKLRQMLPQLLEELHRQGETQIKQIRLKIYQPL
jgi:hypothetical protein